MRKGLTVLSLVLLALVLACGQKGDPRPRRDLHQQGATKASSQPPGDASNAGKP